MIENWLWKSEIGNFWSLDLERVLIYQKIFLIKKCYFSLNQATIWCRSCWKNLKCYLMRKYGSFFVKSWRNKGCKYIQIVFGHIVIKLGLHLLPHPVVAYIIHTYQLSFLGKLNFHPSSCSECFTNYYVLST